MSIYYPGTELCGSATVSYTMNCCPTKELARVRHIAWISDLVPTGFDPTSESEWSTHIDAGEIFVVSDTRGETDGGTWTESDGFGDTVTELEGFTEVITYTDRNYNSNTANYNAVAASKNYRVAFFSETLGWMSDKPATFKPGRPISADAKQAVYGVIQVSYTQKLAPVPFIYPQSIFKCFQVVEV